MKGKSPLNLSSDHQRVIDFVSRIPKFYQGKPHQQQFLDQLFQWVEKHQSIWKGTESTGDDACFDQALAFTLQWEGGYVNHPADPGGATNLGVTQATYNAYRRSLGLGVRSVASLSKEEAKAIYKRDYWDASRCGTMKPRLAVVMFDTAVNFGVGGAIMFLQEALNGGLEIDGKLGPKTYGWLQECDQNKVADDIVTNRIEYRHTRVAQRASQRAFLQGWLNRDNSLRDFINKMAK